MFTKERKVNKFKLVILSTLVVLLSSCSYGAAREDLLEFTNNFSITNCKEKYKKANFLYEKTFYRNGEKKGYRKVTYEFDMTVKGNYSSYLTMENEGEFITPDYPASKKVVTCAFDQQNADSAYSRFTTIDGEDSFTTFSEETFLVDLNNFYGQSVEGKYTNGMYYGDDIKNNFRFQDFMQITEDGQYLIYNTGYFIDNQKDMNILTIYYKVNKDGMVLEARNTGISQPYEDPATSWISTITVEY